MTDTFTDQNGKDPESNRAGRVIIGDKTLFVMINAAVKGVTYEEPTEI